MPQHIDSEHLDRAFESLAFRLKEAGAEAMEIVVCGGSALIATGLVPRTTRDVDVVALMRGGALVSPAPLPEVLVRAAHEVAEDLGLDPDWLNNGPSPGEGGLFFKLFASADRGGYHIDDLRALAPTTEELLAAARWTMTHDVSEGYAMVLEHLLRSLGHGDVADPL